MYIACHYHVCKDFLDKPFNLRTMFSIEYVMIFAKNKWFVKKENQFDYITVLKEKLEKKTKK